MPRQKRVDEAGGIYHALNRGNARQTIFHKPEDYQAFLRTLGDGLIKYPVQLISFCLMPNHWHLVVSPEQDGMMGRMLRWVTATHTRRLPRRSVTKIGPNRLQIVSVCGQRSVPTAAHERNTEKDPRPPGPISPQTPEPSVVADR